MSNLDTLFSPFTLGPLKLANRIVMAPMTRQFSPGNVPNDLVVEYYKRRAEGGVGLIITEGTCIGHKAANGYENVPYFYGEKALAGWKKVVDAVHAAGGKIMPQLWHVGSVRKEGMEPDASVPGFAPSGMVAPGVKKCHVMSKEDITEVITAYADAARSAMELGFDGVEIHAAHGYLIDQFFWAGMNERTDEYGGDIVARTRFGVEVIKAVRAATAPDFPIVLRFSQWKMQDYNARLTNTPAELESFLKPLSDAGVDIFHCSTRRFWEVEFEGSTLNLAGWTRKITGKPAITVGSVGLNKPFVDEEKKGFSGGEPASIDNLLTMLDNKEFDLVAVGRALIANPDWPLRLKENKSIDAYDLQQLQKLV